MFTVSFQNGAFEATWDTPNGPRYVCSKVLGVVQHVGQRMGLQVRLSDCAKAAAEKARGRFAPRR